MPWAGAPSPTGPNGRALDGPTKAAYLRFVGYRYLIKQLEDYLDPDPFDRAPRHYQFFGANFAVTHEMYALAGGMPLVPTSEDVAFHRAIVRVGAKVRHSTLMRVTTSARHQGRAALGLADRLSQFQALGQRQEAFLVESAAAVEAKLLARHQLRRYWMQTTSDRPHPALASQNLAQLAARLAVPLTDLHQAIAQSMTVGELFQRVEQCQQALGAWQQRWATVPIEVAIADLRLSLSQWRSRASRPLSELRPAAVRSRRYAASRRGVDAVVVCQANGDRLVGVQGGRFTSLEPYTLHPSYSSPLQAGCPSLRVLRENLVGWPSRCLLSSVMTRAGARRGRGDSLRCDRPPQN